MFTIVSSLGGCIGVCFFSKTSCILSEGMLGSIRLSKHSGSPVLSSAISLSAAFTLPSIMSLENLLESWSIGVFLVLHSLVKRLWIVFLHPINCPDFHHSKCLNGVPGVSRVLSFLI